MSTPQPKSVRPAITALLIDIAGTLHVGSNPTHNAVEAFRNLPDSHMAFRLCSNSSKESTESLVKHLDEMGFEVAEGASSPSHRKSKTPYHDSTANLKSRRLVWTSLGAVAQLVKNMDLKEPYFLLSDSAREEFIGILDSHGLKDLQAGDEEVKNDDLSRYDSVIVGLSPSSLNYKHLNNAFRILKRDSGSPESFSQTENQSQRSESDKEIHLIATHKGKYLQTETGLSLGPGPFVTALETASGVTARVVGKPTEEFFNMVIDDFSSDELPDDGGVIAIVGDDVESDLGDGALKLGLWRVLVKTGKYRKGDENRPGVTPPDEVLDSFSDFIDSLTKKD